MDACDAGGVGLGLSMHPEKRATQTLRPLSQVSAGTSDRRIQGMLSSGKPHKPSFSLMRYGIAHVYQHVLLSTIKSGDILRLISPRPTRQ